MLFSVPGQSSQWQWGPSLWPTLSHLPQQPIPKRIRIEFKMRVVVQCRCNSYPETVDDGLVLFTVGLDTALDHVQGSEHRVGDATRQETANTTQGIVLAASILTAVRLCGRRKAQLMSSIKASRLPNAKM